MIYLWIRKVFDYTAKVSEGVGIIEYDRDAILASEQFPH